MTNHFVNALIFGCVGVAVEVFFTALAKHRTSRDIRLEGVSYIWMFPIYMLAYPMFVWLWPIIGRWPFIARGLIYVLLAYAMEYGSGWFLRKTIGVCPWEHNYKGKRWSVHDLIRLDYLPAWLIFVLVFERLYLYLR